MRCIRANGLQWLALERLEIGTRSQRGFRTSEDRDVASAVFVEIFHAPLAGPVTILVDRHLSVERIDCGVDEPLAARHLQQVLGGNDLVKCSGPRSAHGKPTLHFRRMFRARDEQCGWAKTLAIASQAPTFCPCLLPIANLPPLPPDSRPVRTVESFSYVCLRFRSACQSSDRLSWRSCAITSLAMRVSRFFVGGAGAARNAFPLSLLHTTSVFWRRPGSAAGPPLERPGCSGLLGPAISAAWLGRFVRRSRRASGRFHRPGTTDSGHKNHRHARSSCTARTRWRHT